MFVHVMLMVMVLQVRCDACLHDAAVTKVMKSVMMLVFEILLFVLLAYVLQVTVIIGYHR